MTAILIIDDDAPTLLAMREVVSRGIPNASIETAPSAHTALKRIEAVDYDLIVSDIRMPGMDGLELLNQIRKIRPYSPVILTTSYDEPEYATKALRLGAHDLLRKPLDVGQFIASALRGIEKRSIQKRRDSERSEATRAAREIEEQYRLVAQTTSDALFTIDEHSTITFASPSVEKTFGYTSEELIGKKLTIVIPTTYRDAHIAGLKRYVETGKRNINWAGVQLPGLHKDGHEIALEISFGEFTKAGIRYFTGLARNVTERKIADQALRESEGRHRFLSELAIATQPLTDPSDVMAVTARLLAEHLGVDRCAYAEVEDENVFVISGDYTKGVPSIVGRWPVAAFGTECTRLMLANEPYIVNDVDKDTRIGANDLAAYRATTIQAVICVPLHKAAKFTAAMAVHQKKARAWALEEVKLVQTVVGHCWEALERARVTRTLRESEAQFRQLADCMPQIVWTARPDGYVDYYNERWYEFTGATRDAGGDESWGPILHPEDVQLCMDVWYTSVKSGKPYEIEYRFKDQKTGEYRWFMGRALPIRDDQDRIIRWIGTCTDIDESKKSEQALKDGDRRKNEFLATLAHELRNPLAPIRNAIQILNRIGSPDPAAQAARDIVDRQVKQMVRLIDDLLDVSRITRGKLELRRERVALAPVVELALESSRPHIEASGHLLSVSLPPQEIFLNADPVRLSQVFSNLLINSAKYTENGGHIWLTAQRDGSDLVVKIKDNGIGISPQHIPKLFEMFSQVSSTTDRSQGGLGIGLALVRGLVEMHDGSITARSEGRGKGSEFSVRLPALTDSLVMPSQGDRVVEAPKTMPSRRILVVDDNRDSAETLAMLLQLAGNDVEQANDGPQAIQKVERFRPDVVLLDIGMPQMDGYTVCRRLREQPFGANITIIAQTGWGAEVDRKQTKEAGFDAHMVKPIDPDTLIKMLSEL